MPLLEAKGISLQFGKIKKLDDCSFHIEENEIFGLLGQNGSGKSSLIKSVLGLYRPSSGEISFSCSREEVGYVPQRSSFFEDYTVEENLKFFASLQKCEKNVNKAIDEFELSEFRKVKASNLSGGYKRILNMAITLLRPLKLVVLDEPTANIDVLMRGRIIAHIGRMHEKGLSVLLTTHYMEEAEEYCDRVALIQNGKIWASGTVPELIGQYGGEYSIRGNSKKPHELSHALEKAGFEPGVRGHTILITIPKSRGGEGLADALKIYSKFEVSSLSIKEPSLSEAMGRPIPHD